MITAAHIVIYSRDAEADRAFFRDILGFRAVDAGHGWLIFALPAAEAAVHPAEHNNRQEVFLTCDDLKATTTLLARQGVRFGAVREERWGIHTRVLLPGGGEIGLYQPAHPITFGVNNVNEARGPATSGSKGIKKNKRGGRNDS
jgi:catechol 2,3-dioxygenase-like lactoylglutathione lyase family enzyme